jgi:hypothetical protein
MTLFILVTVTVFGELVVQSVVFPLLYIEHPPVVFGLKGYCAFPNERDDPPTRDIALDWLPPQQLGPAGTELNVFKYGLLLDENSG